MIRAALPLAFVLVLAGSLASAQQAQPQPSDTQSPASAPARVPDPHRQTMRIAKELNLTPDQAAKVEPILAGRNQKLAALRADTTIDPKTAKKQIKGIQVDTRQQLSTVLTADQFQKFESLQHGRGKKTQEPQQTTPTA